MRSASVLMETDLDVLFNVEDSSGKVCREMREPL